MTAGSYHGSIFPTDAKVDFDLVGPPLQQQILQQKVRAMQSNIEATIRKGLEEALGPIDWNGLPEMLKHLSSEVISGVTIISYKGRQVLEVHAPEISYSTGPDSYSMHVTQRYRALVRPE